VYAAENVNTLTCDFCIAYAKQLEELLAKKIEALSNMRG
jgi:hypothetical protein